MKSFILITALVALAAASPAKPSPCSTSVKPTSTPESRVCDKRCAAEQPKCEKPWYPYKLGECWACCIEEAVGVIE